MIDINRLKVTAIFKVSTLSSVLKVYRRFIIKTPFSIPHPTKQSNEGSNQLDNDDIIISVSNCPSSYITKQPGGTPVDTYDCFSNPGDAIITPFIQWHSTGKEANEATATTATLVLVIVFVRKLVHLH